MPVTHPKSDEKITAEFAQGVIQREIDRCDRRIAAYQASIVDNPREAVSFAVDVARYGHARYAWELGMQVALGNRTLQSLEASLSYRLLSLAGGGTGTVDRMLAEKIELATLEDATSENGVIGLLKKIEGQPDLTREAGVAIANALGQNLLVLAEDPDRLATFAAYTWPELNTREDREDRQADVGAVLRSVCDLLAGRVSL